MKKILTAGFIVVLLVILSCNKNEEKIQALKTDITESVYSSVTIQPDSLYQVYAIVNGILDKNLLEEGDLVNKGDAILQVINASPKLNSENAQLTWQLAQNNYSGNAAVLDAIKDEIEAATLKLTNDSVNYFRQKNLWEKRIGSKTEYDTKKLNYELSSNALIQLKSKYQRTKNELQTKLKQAENNYRTALITNKDFTITSKINGKVYALYKNPGEIVNTIEPLASIGNDSQFVIEMLVDEVDIVKIKPDQQVIITLDAYQGDVFSGIVTKIYPKKDERNQTFKVEALFKDIPTQLYPGLSGEANIIIADKKDVLTIPKNYLLNDNYVLIKNDTVTVVTGIQDMDVVEIISGISEDTWIYKPEE